MTPRTLRGYLLLAALAGCSIPPSDAQYTPQALPDQGSFPPVAQLLVVRCGSLDCHGTPARNLRLYGSAGLRWTSSDRPFVPLCDTQDEVAQDYESVVDLEPETMSQVVASGGMEPERLTFVRKARGTESHKGGAVIARGDPRDVCITTWLQGNSDAASCTAALSLP